MLCSAIPSNNATGSDATSMSRVALFEHPVQTLLLSSRAIRKANILHNKSKIVFYTKSSSFAKKSEDKCAKELLIPSSQLSSREHLREPFLPARRLGRGGFLQALETLFRPRPCQQISFAAFPKGRAFSAVEITS